MRIDRLIIVLFVLSLGAVTPAAAQDAGKLGVTMGYPASIGVIWHASDKVAIRPELALAGGSGGTSGTSFDIDNDSWTVGTGVSALFYLRSYDRLRTYVVPRYSYIHNSSSATGSGFTTTTSTAKGNSHAFTGSFGAQYNLSDRFAMFAEVGFGFSHSTSSGSTSTTTSTTNSWGTRSGVGATFYF